MRQLLMVRYGEIYLKGLNRPYFMKALVKRVKQATKEFKANVWLHDARIFVSDMTDADACMERVRKVFGVHSVCPAIEMEKDDIDAIGRKAAEMMKWCRGCFMPRRKRL